MNFTKATFFNLFITCLLAGMSMVTGIIKARLLGPEGMGRFQLFLTTQTFFTTILAFGIGQACIYFINSLKVPVSLILATAVKGILPAAVVAGFLLFGLIDGSPAYFGHMSLWALVLFSVGCFALLLVTIFRPVLLANLEVVKNQTVQFVTQIFMLVCVSALAVFLHRLEISYLIALTGLSNMLSLAILYRYFRSRFSFRTKIDYTLLKRLIGWGIRLAGNNIAVIFITSAPIYFLSWFSGDGNLENVGYYSRVSSILNVGTLIFTSTGPLLYAKWTAIDRSQLKPLVHRTGAVFMGINLVISAGLFLFAPFIVNLLYGQAYMAAVPALRILSLSMVFNGVKEMTYNVLSSQGKPQRILVNLLITLVILMIMLFFTVPRYGVTGCAVSVLFASVISTFLLVFDCTRISDVSVSDFFAFPTYGTIKTLLNNLK